MEKVEETARALAGILVEEGLYEVAVEAGGETLRLRRRRGPSAPLAMALPPADSEESAEESLEELAVMPVTSKVVGLVHLEGPDGTARVRAGQKVRQGQLLLLLESMGLDHEVHSPVEGEVLEILVHEAEPVEYGQALLLVQPA